MVNVIFCKMFNQILELLVRMVFNFKIIFEALLPVFSVWFAVPGRIANIIIPSRSGIIVMVTVSEAVGPSVNGRCPAAGKQTGSKCRAKSKQKQRYSDSNVEK